MVCSDGNDPVESEKQGMQERDGTIAGAFSER